MHASAASTELSATYLRQIGQVFALLDILPHPLMHSIPDDIDATSTMVIRLYPRVIGRQANF